MHTQDAAAQSARSAPDTQPPGPDEQPAPPARSRGAALVGWVVTIALNVVAPIVTYNALHDHGWSEFSALLVSGCLAGARQRRSLRVAPPSR
ncbi:hypothetical protein [Streptomyces sp. NPDC097640]|uniref:hypothetical protein n=1 Tax=Streptomyces sp. NPDC097640 TaxID=3157229 RepID=UPI00332D88A6